jgi:hypothetical protein
MSIRTASVAWRVLQDAKLKHLKTWEPTPVSLTDLTSIPDMAKALNNQMSAAMDVEEVHQAAYALATEVAALSYEDFVTWNQQEVQRAQETGQLMSEISSAKLLASMGL